MITSRFPSFFALLDTMERIQQADLERKCSSGVSMFDLQDFVKGLERINRDSERIYEAANRVEGWIFIPMYERMVAGENVTFDDIEVAISRVIVDLNLESLEEFTSSVIRSCLTRWDYRMEMREYREERAPQVIEPPTPPPSCVLCGEPHIEEPCREVARLEKEDGSRWGQFEPAVRRERGRWWRRYPYYDF